MKFDFDDILITPADITNINTRSAIHIHDEEGYLPIFTAPMDTVVNRENAHLFIQNGIRVVLPREKITGTDYYATNSARWYSYSLSDFKTVFIDSIPIESNTMYALIDVANGHMPAVRDMINAAKNKYGSHLQIMAGNIANPETFRVLSDAGADYIRVGIGNGCFIDGTNINTINGKKRIEEVVDGDLVLTHNCNYKEVISTKRFEYTGELIKINDDITCTPDHEFYVLPKKYSDIVTDENMHSLCEWVSAMELYNNPDYLLIETDDYEKTNSIQD